MKTPHGGVKLLPQKSVDDPEIHESQSQQVSKAQVGSWSPRLWSSVGEAVGREWKQDLLSPITRMT